MEKYSLSIISSSIKYLKNLQYLSMIDTKTLNNIFELDILNSMYDWLIWQEKPNSDKQKIEKLMNSIINSNSHIDNLFTTNNYYKNINTQQTIYTWQRVYDDKNVNEFQGRIETEENEITLTEDNNYIIFE